VKPHLKQICGGLALIILTAAVTIVLFKHFQTHENAQPESLQKSEVVQLREVSGEVFIVLQSRETIKMSLVDLYFVDDQHGAAVLHAPLTWTTNEMTLAKAMSDYLEEDGWSTNNTPWDKSLAVVTRSLEKARAHQGKIESTRKDAKQQEREHKANVEIAISKRDLIRLLPSYKRNKEWDANEEFRRKELVAALEAGYKDGRLELDNIRASIRVAVLDKIQSEFVNQLCKAASRSVTTDADGKFKAVIPGSSKFYILARSSRITPSGSENYLWLVPVSDEKAQRIVLSNNNQL
jgi:hypothetical protein